MILSLGTWFCQQMTREKANQPFAINATFIVGKSKARWKNPDSQYYIKFKWKQDTITELGKRTESKIITMS